MKNKRYLRVMICLVIAAAMIILTGIRFGSATLSMGEIIQGLIGKNPTTLVIITRLRIPRVLGAILSGCALSVAGLLLQSATDNDLASPNVVGVNAGAGLGVMIILCFAPMAYRWIPLAAFVGGMIAVFLVLGISETSHSHQRKATMILAGVAVGALLNAGISFLSQRNTDVLGSYAYFTTGSFNGVFLKDLPIPGIIIVVGIILSIFLAPRLNLLCLGDDIASGLGVNVKKLRIASLLLASALCGASVTYAGLIGFVGLIVPHICRRLVGSDLKKLMPCACLLGSSLVALADLVGRTLFAPAEISAGVFLSVLGAPFFVFLLYKRRSS